MENKPNGKTIVKGTLEKIAQPSERNYNKTGAKIDNVWYNCAPAVLKFIPNLVGQNVTAEVKDKVIQFITATSSAIKVSDKVAGYQQVPKEHVIAAQGNNRETLIIRQNVLRTAARILCSDGNVCNDDDVIGLAETLEKWVLR